MIGVDKRISLSTIIVVVITTVFIMRQGSINKRNLLGYSIEMFFKNSKTPC